MGCEDVKDSRERFGQGSGVPGRARTASAKILGWEGTCHVQAVAECQYDRSGMTQGSAVAN